MIFALINNIDEEFIVVNTIVLADDDTSLYDGKFDYIIQICNRGYKGSINGWSYDPNLDTFTQPPTLPISPTGPGPIEN